MNILLRNLVAGAALSLVSQPLWAAELVMVEQAGCHYCERWNAELGPIYPKTAEGAHAPLRRVELGGEEMEKLHLERRVNFTPTFILVDESDHEVVRLEGYPGEDFFWGIIGKMLQDHTDFEDPQAVGG